MLRILKQLIATISIFAFLTTSSHAMFIQPDWLDPTEPGVGTNRYAYSFNDPINQSDPNGNFAISIGIGIAIGLSALAAGWAADNAVDMSDDGQYNGSRGLGISSGIIDATDGLFGGNSVHSESDGDGDGSESSDDSSSGSNNNPDPNDEDEEAAKLARDAKRMSPRALDKAAKKNGYRDTHDLKNDFGLSGPTDIFSDKNGDMYEGNNLGGSGRREPLGINKGGF